MNQADRLHIETVVRALAAKRAIKLTLHAHQEMVEEDITVSELLAGLENCTLLENYPDYERGACCLVCG